MVTPQFGAHAIAQAIGEEIPDWTGEPGQPTEPRNIAYLIGPGTARIKITVMYDRHDKPTGKLKFEPWFGELAHMYAPPGIEITRSRTLSTAKAPDQLAAQLERFIADYLADLETCHEYRLAIAAQRDGRQQFHRQIAELIAPEQDPNDPSVMDGVTYIGKLRTHGIAGSFSASDPNRVRFNLTADHPTGIELAHKIAEILNRDTHPGDDTDPADAPAADDESPF